MDFFKNILQMTQGQTPQESPVQQAQAPQAQQFDWNDSNLVMQKRQQAIQSGYKASQVDEFIKKQQNEYATLQLAKEGKLTDTTYKDLEKTNPQLALKITQVGGKPGDQKAEDIKNDLSTKAQALLDVLDAGKTGKLTGQAYVDARNFAASQYAAAKGFGEGGKALTGPELTTLGGQIPVIKQRGQSFIDKITGNIPSQKGYVDESDDSLKRKAQIALKVARGEPVDYAELNSEQSPQGLNVGGDISNIINSFLGAPAEAIQRGQDVAKQIQENPSQSGQIAGQLQPNNLLFNMLKGYGGNLLSDIGNPQQGGDIVGRVGENFQQRPVSTILDILPFLAAGKSRLASGGDVVKTGEAASIPQKMGTSMRARVRDIDVGPSLYGPQKEAVVNERLNTMGISGSPAQQYAQLQPKMSELGGQIKDYLKENSTSVPITEVKNAFMGNLEEQLLSKSLSAKTAVKEVNGFLGDLYKSSFNKGLGTDITTTDLFQLKTKVNKLYKDVEKKLNTGQSLSDREQVIYVARKTLDDLIAGEHPELKDMTLNQSALFDAVDSLYQSRKKAPILKVFGNPIPIPGGQQIQAGQDLLGKILSGGR